MEQFKNLFRDTTIHNNPEGTYQFARNIVKSKKFGSIANEDGFKEIISIDGIQIGTIVTNKETVIFSKHEEYDEIGIKRIFNGAWQYKVVLRGDLGFKLNCPIEGIFIYNYKEELIVVWSDGIRINSSKPKLLNLTKLPFDVDVDFFPLNNDELSKINLFPNVNEGRLEVENLEGGDIQGNVAWFTFCYVFNDNTSSLYFPISTIGYGASGYDPITRNGFDLRFFNLDSLYNKIKIGIVVKEDGQLKAFESYPIEYTKNIDSDEPDLIFSLTSLSNFSSIAVEDLVISKDIFAKVKTLTKQSNRIVVGNTRKDDFLNFQKYANKLILMPIVTTPVNQEEFMRGTFSPDEVYSIYIELQKLDGSYTDAFHIPGRGATPGEEDFLSGTLRTQYGLQDAPSDARVFHYINSGDIDPVGTGSLQGVFGFWRNEERYPDKPEYNSADIGGEDLRGKYIRYHRFPGMDNIHETAWARNLLPRRVEVGDLEDNLNMITFGIRMKNFDDVVPQEIKDQIQGYRLSFVKRNFGNSLVVGHSLLFAAAKADRLVAGTTNNNDGFKIDAITPYYQNHLEIETGDDYDYKNGFSYGALISEEIFKNKPKTTVTHAKANYIVGTIASWKNHTGGGGTVTPAIINSTIIDDADRFAFVDNQIKYLPSNNFAAGSMFQEETNRIKFKRNNWAFFSPNDSIDNHNWYVPVITLYQLKYNLYSGFKSTDLVIIGRTDKINEGDVDFYGGDVFITPSIDMSLYSTLFYNNESGIWSEQKRLRFKGLYQSVNELQLYNVENQYSDDVARNGLIQSDWQEFPERPYEITLKGEEDLSTINNIVTIQSWNINPDFIFRFPYRVNRGLSIPTENITTNALRSFLTSDYKDMPNDKGEIVALRGSDRVLYIQQEFALFVGKIKDVLQTGDTETFLGTGDIFDREPQELVPDDKGYIGCTSQYVCYVFKAGYVTFDSLKGKFFLVNQGISELSSEGLRNWFRNNASIGLDLFEYKEDGVTKITPDNPFVSVGYISSYDEENNRILITKRDYKLKSGISPELYTTDGQFYTLVSTGKLIDFNNTNFFTNESKTLSYSLDENGWICEHDYTPNILYYNNEGIFSILNDLSNFNSKVYKHNDHLTKGLYYGVKHSSYIDLIFNVEKQVSKIAKALQWITEVIKPNGVVDRDKTITHIMVYNYDQCTGVINIKDNIMEVTRNAQGTWKYNKIRDIVKDKTLPIILDNGDININNLEINKPFFEKRNFISKFVVVRLIMDNVDNNTTLINSVNINSLITKR